MNPMDPKISQALRKIEAVYAGQEVAHAYHSQENKLRKGESFVAVLEVCGFNDWLIRMLHDYRCHKVILIQPDDRKRCKTDRRDAASLSELLWVNRDRLLEGKPVRGVRQVALSAAPIKRTGS
jgi:hypothetical protein